MVTKEELISYIEKVKVRKPNNPGKSYAVNDLIANIPLTVDLLFEIVNCETDQSLSRFDSDFFYHLEEIVHLTSFDKLPIAIEGLAQKYESFIKKIAYLKYKDKDPRYFYGDKHTKGITGTTLASLCEGILHNTDKGEAEGAIQIELPDKLLDYRGVKRYFADFVRNEIRNKVHVSQEYQRNELILLSEIVLVLYFITVQDNHIFLSNLFLKESRYLISVAEQFNIWQSKFVHILGLEDNDRAIDNIDLDFIESDFDLSELQESEESEESEEEEKYSDREKGKISDLLHNYKRLIILGAPGMGKTTTMQFLTFHLAKANDKIPVYHELRHFTEELDLVEELSRVMGIDENSFYELLNSERLVILLDGINEVIRKEARTKLFQQVNYLLKLSNKFNFIASSRKSGYNNDFNLPVFQLQLMTDEQIEEFIKKNYVEYHSEFLTLLKKNSRINEWARNPLMLTMLISVAKKTNGKIPENTGKLLRAFIDGIYKREIRRNPAYNSEIAKLLLSDLAFVSREDKLVGFNKAYALQILTNKKNKHGFNEDVLALLNSFIDINVLSVNEEQISFTHELYQEYFAAEELHNLFSVDRSLISKYIEDKNWLEVIILFNGLTEGDESVKAIANKNPLVAALAINDTLNPSIDSINLVLEKAKEAFKLENGVEKISSSLKSLISLKLFDDAYLVLSNIDPHNKKLKKAIRAAISECYDLVSHNEMIDLLNLIWNLFKSSSTKLNLLSPYFKNIPTNGLSEIDESHEIIARSLANEFLDLYFIGKGEKNIEDNMPYVYRTYLVKPLIVINKDFSNDTNFTKKVLATVRTLIGIGKPELAYPIIKKFKFENEIDLMKLIKKLIKKNSLEKAKLLVSIFYDDEFCMDQKKENILKTVISDSNGIVYLTAVELALENGYKEKLINIIDMGRYDEILSQSTDRKISIPKPIIEFNIQSDISIEKNVELFFDYCNTQEKIPMRECIEMFNKQFPMEYSKLYRLLSEKIFTGTVVVKYEYGLFLNCPKFNGSKTVFAHSSQTKETFDNTTETQKSNFRIIGYSKERQRINVRLC